MIHKLRDCALLLLLVACTGADAPEAALCGQGSVPVLELGTAEAGFTAYLPGDSLEFFDAPQGGVFSHVALRLDGIDEQSLYRGGEALLLQEAEVKVLDAATGETLATSSATLIGACVADGAILVEEVRVRFEGEDPLGRLDGQEVDLVATAAGIAGPMLSSQRLRLRRISF